MVAGVSSRASTRASPGAGSRRRTSHTSGPRLNQTVVSADATTVGSQGSSLSEVKRTWPSLSS